MIKEKEIDKLLDEGKVVIIGKEKGIININIENNECNRIPTQCNRR